MMIIVLIKPTISRYLQSCYKTMTWIPAFAGMTMFIVGINLPTNIYAQDIPATTPPVKNLTPAAGPSTAPAREPEVISLEEAMKEKPLRFIEVEELPPVEASNEIIHEDDQGEAVDPNTVAADAHFTPTALSNVNLHGIHKLTGRAKALNGQVGDMLRFAELEITVHKCSSVMDQGERGYAALIAITQSTLSEAEPPIFRGWLFSTSPSLSSIGHPQYDVLLQSCSAA